MEDKAMSKWLERKKAKAQFWQIKNFFNGLRLKYKEENKKTEYYSIAVPLFGLRVRFSNMSFPEDNGWKVFVIEPWRLEDPKETEKMREEIFWFLVEKGYLAYIRECDGNSHKNVFNSILISQNWGYKIIQKRIELCGLEPQNTFMRVRMEEFSSMSISRIISIYPGFFDYLM